MGKLLKQYGDIRPSNACMGIDQSYSGFAITLLRPASGYLDEGHQTTVWRLIGEDAERLWDAQQIVAESINGVREVAMEGYSFGSKHNREMSGELGGAVKLALRPRKPRIVPPTLVKKYATGRGNASKTEVVMAVYKKWGVEFDDDNAADSYVVARIAAGLANTDYEREVLTRLEGM